jgi:hypothetical protein
MRASLTHYPSVHISTNVYDAKELVKVRIGTFFYDELIGEFYVPASSVVKMGNLWYVPDEIIKARAKHDLKMTFDSHSAGLLPKSE